MYAASYLVGHGVAASSEWSYERNGGRIDFRNTEPGWVKVSTAIVFWRMGYRMAF
jgi:hypothetical protein